MNTRTGPPGSRPPGSRPPGSRRLIAALLAFSLLAGPVLSLAQVPLREGARMARAEGGGNSALKAALAALASAVSGVALGSKANSEVPVSP